MIRAVIVENEALMSIPERRAQQALEAFSVNRYPGTEELYQQTYHDFLNSKRGIIALRNTESASRKLKFTELLILNGLERFVTISRS